MSVQAEIENILNTSLSPEYLQVENESYQHNVPPGSESHFKVVIVSKDFTDKRLVARHQLIYKTLGEVVKSKIHALALHTYTPEEWQERQATAPESPLCRGGGKVGVEG
jgi:BolA protein